MRLPRVGRNGFFLPKIFVLNIWALKSQKKTRPFPNFCPGQLFRGGCQIDPPTYTQTFKQGIGNAVPAAKDPTVS